MFRPGEASPGGASARGLPVPSILSVVPSSLVGGCGLCDEDYFQPVVGEVEAQLGRQLRSVRISSVLPHTGSRRPPPHAAS